MATPTATTTTTTSRRVARTTKHPAPPCSVGDSSPELVALPPPLTAEAVFSEVERACQEDLEEIGAQELLDALNDAITFGEGTTFYVRVY